jgi:hypothetical protein
MVIVSLIRTDQRVAPSYRTPLQNTYADHINTAFCSRPLIYIVETEYVVSYYKTF